MNPCELFVNTKARPFVIHKHSPVAILWEKETKKGLERDTNMGVIGPKLVGEPIVWCGLCCSIPNTWMEFGLG